mmetsp:Transcript_23950/g.50225  ORF Transcript_23950/g.50225 Transcript_23950/m.50225 type:complete len:220 (+) Transcript_23950:1004-1663(+)
MLEVWRSLLIGVGLPARLMDLRLVRLRPQICRSRSIRVDWLVHAPLHLRLMRAARALMLGACVKLGSVLLMRRAAVARAAVVRRLLLLLLHAPLLIVGGGVGAIERGLRLDTGDVLVELEVVVEAALRRLGRVVAQTERAKVRVEAGERVVVGRRGETGRASRALLAVLGRAALEAEDALLRRHRAEQLRVRLERLCVALRAHLLRMHLLRVQLLRMQL